MPDGPPDTDRIRAIYDRLAPSWDRREGSAERYLMGNTLRASLGRRLHGDVLELGSGTGATFPCINWNTVSSLTATDLSGGMLDQARQHQAIRDKPVTFQQVDASQLPFDDNSFDTVTTSLMLCTVPDLEQTLREMSRVVRPGGRIVLLEHVRAPNRLIAGVQRLLSPWQQRRMGCHLDRPTDRLVREMGFGIEYHQTRFFGIFHLLVLTPRARKEIEGLSS